MGPFSFGPPSSSIESRIIKFLNYSNIEVKIRKKFCKLPFTFRRKRQKFNEQGELIFLTMQAIKKLTRRIGVRDRNYNLVVYDTLCNYSFLSQSFHFVSIAHTPKCHWTSQLLCTECVLFLFTKARVSDLMYSCVIANLLFSLLSHRERHFQSRTTLTRLLLSSIIKQNWIA